MRKTHIIIALAAIIVAVILAGGQSSDAPHRSDTHLRSAHGRPDGDSRIRDGRLDWGLYEIYWGVNRFARRLEHDLALLATSPDYLMFYRDLGRRFPKGGIEIIRRCGATPIISLELWRWGDGGGDYLERINRGEYDAFFAQWAADAKADGGRVLLRFGFEFNGDWFSWGNKPVEFVAAWKRAHRIFEDNRAANVEWVWAANVVSVPDTDDNDMHLFYPGADAVDWVAIDGYNWGDEHDQWHRWESCEQLFADVVSRLAKRYPTKPIMIAEFGSVDGAPGQKAEWIRAAHAWLTHQPRIHAAIWFNHDKRREGEHNWRIDSTPEALQAFNETFAAP